MTTTRAAKYLAPVDLGKTIQLLDRYTGEWPTGTFEGIETTNHPDAYILVTIRNSLGFTHTYDIHPHDEVSITGQDSPPATHGSDQAEPAEQLPAPIPAAQAADGRVGYTTLDAALGAHCGHNGGQGIGAGHTCACVRADGHPHDSDRPHGCPCGAVWKD